MPTQTGPPLNLYMFADGEHNWGQDMNANLQEINDAIGAFTGSGGAALPPNLILASPDGAPGPATFRALAAADVPMLAQSQITNLEADLATIDTRLDTVEAAATMPSGAPNLVLATPDGAAGQSSLRALVVPDIPVLPYSSIDGLTDEIGNLWGNISSLDAEINAIQNQLLLFTNPQPTPAQPHQFLTSFNDDGTFSQAQPGFADLSGTILAAQLIGPTTATFGGVKALAATPHLFVTSIGTDGVPVAAQPTYADIAGTPGAGVVTWDKIGAAAAALTLNNTTFGTTFNQTTATPAWTWANTQAATSGANRSSPKLQLSGQIWNGSASVADTWQMQVIYGTGANPTTTLALAHSVGSGNTAAVSAPQFNGNLVGNMSGGDVGTSTSGILNIYCMGTTPHMRMSWNGSNLWQNFIGLVAGDAGVNFYSPNTTPMPFCLTNEFLTFSAGTGDPQFGAAPAPDVGLSRLGAASLALGNGANGDFSGVLKLGTVSTVSTVLGGGYTQTAADNFARANENPISNGGKWVAGFTPFAGITTNGGQLIGNLFEGTANNIFAYSLWQGNGATFDSSSQSAEVTLGTFSSSTQSAAVVVRGSTSAATCYRGVIVGPTGGTGQLWIDRYNAGSFTYLTKAAAPYAIAVGDKIRISAEDLPNGGTALYLYQNGILLLTAFDANPLPPGLPGMQVYVGGSGAISAVSFSAWAAGVTVPSNGQQYLLRTFAATATQNVNSPMMSLGGQYWTGSASAMDCWNIQDIVSNGTNPPSTLQITHYGSVPSSQQLAVNLVNSAPATASVSQASVGLVLTGSYWAGSVTQPDSWSIQNVVGNGTNGASSLTFTHTGTTGAASIVGPTFTATNQMQANGFLLSAAAVPIGTYSRGLFCHSGLGANVYVQGNNLSSFTFAVALGGTFIWGIGSSTQVMHNSSMLLCWSATGSANSGNDTGISRVSAGLLAIGAGSTVGDASGALTVAKLIENTSLTATSAGTAGVTGQIAWDTNNIYICTNGGAAGAATWKKAALAAA